MKRYLSIAVLLAWVSGCGGKDVNGSKGKGDDGDKSPEGDTDVLTPDNTPPDLVNVTATSHTGVFVVFSEGLAADSVSAERFHIQGDDGAIAVTAAALQGDGLSVDLTVAAGMRHGHTYTLTVSGVADVADNAMAETQRTFLGRGLVAAVLSGVPDAATTERTASITVGGDDVVAYQYALTGPDLEPAFSAETSVDAPIALADLVDGAYILEVVGKDSHGNWQPYEDPTLAQWLVDNESPTAVILSGPASLTGERNAAFTIGGAGVVAFAYELNGGERSAEIPVSALSLSLLPAGDHVLHVFGRDAAGNWQPNESPTVHAWTIDYSLPVAELSGLPNDPTNLDGATIGVAGAGVVAYRYRLDGGAWSEPALAEDAIVLTDLEDGAHSLEVLARDIYDGWQPEETPTSHNWHVDTEAPTAVLSNTPSALTSQSEADIAVGGGGVHLYMFALDGASFSEPVDAEITLHLEDLTEGTHVLDVRAGDRAGNWQDTPTTITWEIDFSAPTAVLSGLPLFFSNVDTASITVGGTDIVAYVFSFDGESFSSEQDTSQLIELSGLSEGAHTLSVLGRDLADNWQAPENATTFSWTVDLTAPEAVVVNGPVNPTNVTHANFDIGGADVEGYRFKLDDGEWSEERDVGEPVEFAVLDEGEHALQLVGRDLAGNWQKDDAATVFAWTIDLSPPVASLGQLPNNPTNDTSLAVTVAGPGVVAYRYSLDGETFSGEISSDTAISATDLSEGEHTLLVVAKDASGNWQSQSSPSSFTWTVDLTAPVATWSGLPASPTRQTLASIVVAGTDVAQYRYKLDDAAWTGRFDVTRVLELEDLEEGSHTLLVVGLDVAGNEDLNEPLSHTWTVDVTAPTASVAAIAPASSPTNSLAFELSVSGTDVVAYRFQVDGGALSGELSVGTHATGSVVGEGAHLVEVIGRDVAGNWQSISEAASFTWSVDLTAPVAQLSNLPALLTNLTTTDIGVGGADVTAYRYRLNGGALSSTFDVSESIELSGLTAGSYEIDVIGRDAVGNWQALNDATSFAWQIDLTAPTAVFSGLPAALTNVTALDVSVGGTDIATYSYSLDGGAWSSFRNISLHILATLSEGEHTLRAVGRDLVPNTQSEASATSFTWTIDTTAPTATLSGLPSNPTQSTGATITVAGTDVAAYRYRLDGGSWSSEQLTNVSIVLGSLSEAQHTLEVIGRDAAGNWQSTATSHVWTVDTTAPTPPSVSDTVGSIGNAGVYDNELSLTFSWNNPSDAAAVAIQVATDAAFTNVVHGGANGANVGTADTYVYVASASNGSRHYARVRVRDAAGNWSAFGAASDGIDIVGGVSGKVKDSNLNNVSGASVRLERADGSLIATATTNASGDFSFSNAPIGESAYHLEVSKTGFNNATKNNVTVSVGLTTDVGVIYIVSTSATAGKIYGKVVNANDGAQINNSTVTIRDWTGATVRTLTSNSSGDFDSTTPTFSPGTYSLVISKTGYFDLVVDNVIVDGDRNVERQALCEILSEPHVRTVLLWGSSPNDLDLHVVGPSTTTLSGGAPTDRFHVYWDNRKSFNNNTGAYTAAADPNGASSTTSLVQDDREDYGPEAINLFGFGNGYAHGVYTFSVHKWSSGGTWYDAAVTLRLYDSQGMVREIPIPNGAGTLRYWQAFKLDIQGNTRAQRTLTVVNTFASLTYNSKSSMNW